MRNILFLLMLCNNCFSQDAVQPALEYVMELKVTTDKAMIIGNTSHGERRMVPITGGEFKGQKLRGTVLNGGADYQFFTNTPDGGGRTEIEAIYTIKTDDNVLINIRNLGIVRRSKESLEAQKLGKQLDSSKLYFRASPKFEAPQDSKYAWLNDALFISKGIPSGKGYVTIQVWKVL